MRKNTQKYLYGTGIGALLYPLIFSQYYWRKIQTSKNYIHYAMTSIAINKALIAFIRGKSVFIADLKNGHLNRLDIQAREALRTLALNQDGTLLATASDDKILSLIKCSDGSVLCSRHLPRKPSAIYFARDSKGDTLIVGDKTGETFAFPVPDVSSNIKSLFGHTTSMITDLVVTRDSKYIVTSDRDEKIRVSRFPRTTCIETYCLGHEGYVSSMDLLYKNHLLVSCGGDGTIRLWNFLTGELLHTTYLPKTNDNEMIIPKFISSSPNENIVAVLPENCKSLFYFYLKDNSLEFLKEEKLVEEADSICFSCERFLLVAYPTTPYLTCMQYPIADQSPSGTLDVVAMNTIEKISQLAEEIVASKSNMIVPDICKQPEKKAKTERDI